MDDNISTSSELTRVNREIRELEQKIIIWEKENVGKEIPAFYLRQLSYLENTLSSLEDSL